MQEEAAKKLSSQQWHSPQYSCARRRCQRYGHLGLYCTVLALKYMEDEEKRVEFLGVVGDRWGMLTVEDLLESFYRCGGDWGEVCCFQSSTSRIGNISDRS